jgi:hypothetical protein
MAEQIILIGGIPIRLVQNLTHAMGSTAVGHAVGRGVRIAQITSSDPPDRVQLKCIFIGQNKTQLKNRLELLKRSKLPFPFVSRLVAIPLVTILDLTFSNSSDRKDLFDGKPLFDFVITMQEFKVNSFVTLGFKFSWFEWTLATQPDPASGKKLYTTPPDANQLSAIATSETIQSNAIDLITTVDIEEESLIWNTEELVAANILNRKFDRIPTDPNGVFPQVIKLQYVLDQNHSEIFNSISNLPNDYSNTIYYEFPSFLPNHIQQLVIKFLVKETEFETIVTMQIIDQNGVVKFNRKIVPEIIYIVGIYEITFNEIDIKSENINPVNEQGGNFGSKLEGGIRIK